MQGRLLESLVFLQVDHPLCLECTAKVREEVAATLAEVEAECAAYQTGLDQLEKEASKQPSSEVGRSHSICQK